MMTIYESITKGLTEAIEHEKGTIKARSNRVKVEPLVCFDRAEIKAIRRDVKMTQAVFANFLGVSPKTVEAWEAGMNKPSGPASRVLSMLKKDPTIPEKYKFIKR